MQFCKIQQSHVKIAFFTFLGHILELYDYTIFVVLLPIVSPLFFPANDLSSAINIGMLVFAASILISIPGALFWGKLGDRFGRLVMLRKAIMMMGLPSLVIALLPTYADIGIAAPIILFLCRIVQTFSASGEMNGGRIFLTEHFGLNYVGRVTGYFSCMGALGVLLAMFLGWVIDTYEMSWRIPFILGSSLAVLSMILRKKLSESPEFVAFATSYHLEDAKSISIFVILRHNINKVMVIFAITAVLGTLSYMMHGFINPFLMSFDVDMSLVYHMGIVGLLSCGVVAILCGYIIDRHHNEHFIIRANFIAVMFLIPLGYWLIKLYLSSLNTSLLYMAYILFGGLLGMNVSAAGAINFKLFAPQERCRGILISYALSMAIFGGLTPICLKILSEINFFAPGFALSAVALFGYCIYFVCMRRQY